MSQVNNDNQKEIGLFFFMAAIHQLYSLFLISCYLIIIPIVNVIIFQVKMVSMFTH